MSSDPKIIQYVLECRQKTGLLKCNVLLIADLVMISTPEISSNISRAI